MCIREAKSILKRWFEFQSGNIKSPEPELGRTLEALDFLFKCLEEKEDNIIDSGSIENMLIEFTMVTEGKKLPIDDVKLETAVDFYQSKFK